MRHFKSKYLIKIENRRNSSRIKSLRTSTNLLFYSSGQSEKRPSSLVVNLIRVKEQQCAELLNLAKFCVNKWKRRYEIKNLLLVVKVETLTKKSLIDEYKPQIIFNCDVTRVYFRALPD